MNYLVQKLEDWGHCCIVINGKHVQDYVESHFSNQKTDLNDAQALAFLARDSQLRTVTAKDREQQKYASLTTLREQYLKQYRQTIVSLKGICQAWGLRKLCKIRNFPNRPSEALFPKNLTGIFHHGGID